MTAVWLDWFCLMGVTSKPHKPKPTKKSRGTLLAEQMRAEGNKLTDAQREKLSEEFLKLYYGGDSKPATTRRR